MRAIERRGLPANEEAERFVLGSVLLNGNRFGELAVSIELEDFSSETNRRIWSAMCELSSRGVGVDRVTLADELMRTGTLESIGGLSYLVGLDEGLPYLANLADYCGILREKKILRDVIHMARSIEESAASGQDSASGLLGRAEVMVRALGLQTVRSSAFLSPREIIQAAGNLDGYLSQDRALGIPTGFPALDGMTGGLKPGELWVIAAETGGGKSTFASHITQNMTRAGFPMAFASLEMTTREVTDGLICRAAGINTQALRRGGNIQSIRWAANQVAELPLYILDRPGVTIPKLHAELRRLRAEKGITAAVVDYLQLMQPVGHFARRDLEIGHLTRGLKLIAMDLQIGIIAISQLSRPGDKAVKRRPELADLKESSSIEQDANVVIMLYGEYQPQKLDKYPWEVLIRKQRGGPVGMIPYLWKKSTGTFIEAADGE